MYCKNCSYRLVGTERYCPNCGDKVNFSYDEINNKSDESNKSTESIRSSSITLGIISLVGVFLGVFAPVSLILSVIGLVFAIKSSKKVTNTAGIILNAISLFLSLIITAFIALVIYFIAVEAGSIPDNFNDYIPDSVIERNIDNF